MISRSLAPTLRIALLAAALAACSPPGFEPAEGAGAEAPSGAAEPRDTARPSPSAPLRERRADASAAPASGEYRYIDERGQVRLAARLEDVPERQRSTASRIEAPVMPRSLARENDAGRPVQTADITIYTTQGCGYCRAAMAYFDKRGLDYVNRDVEVDVEARAEYLELTGGRRGVPVIVVGDAWLQGWSQAEFDRLLAASR